MRKATKYDELDAETERNYDLTFVKSGASFRIITSQRDMAELLDSIKANVQVIGVED